MKYPNVFLLLLYAFCLLLTACESEISPPVASSWFEIRSRGINGQRIPLYRIRAPDAWIRRDFLPDDMVIDTTKPLCEFLIVEDEGVVRITIHNFSVDSMENRIPPEMQAMRWRRQLEELNHATITPQAFSGYVGILFSAEGKMHGNDVSVMGWSMQLASEHFRALTKLEKERYRDIYKQMKADVTIKASGPSAALEKNRDLLMKFARSFELIDEIPSSTGNQ